MRRRGGGWRVAAWAALAVAVVMAVVAVGTQGRCIAWGSGGKWIIGVTDRTLFFLKFDVGSCPRGWMNMPTSWYEHERWVYISFLNGLAVGVSGRLLAAASLLLAGFSYWRFRRIRFAPGLCHRCGYSRDGLAPEAPCPECGSDAAH